MEISESKMIIWSFKSSIFCLRVVVILVKILWSERTNFRNYIFLYCAVEMMAWEPTGNIQVCVEIEKCHSRDASGQQIEMWAAFP